MLWHKMQSRKMQELYLMKQARLFVLNAMLGIQSILQYTVML